MTLTEPVADGIHDADPEWRGMIREDVAALIASTFPVRPPRKWFDDPGLSGVTPLTVESTGRVFGHIATWKQSHIGMAGGVRAPRSRSKYAFFQTGALECDDGTYTNVGQITLAGGHAALDASVAEAVAHYDNTQSAVMDVAAGEDRHGIWVAGALRPDVDEVRLRSLRASSVSGDWRPINGNLELVAVCAVNVPGFPLPRARVASGQPVALVAAGTEELVQIAVLDRFGLDVEKTVTAAIETVDERLRTVEDVLLDRTLSRRSDIDSAVEQAKELEALRAAADQREAQQQAIREHVKGPEPKPEPKPEPRLDPMRAVWDGDGGPMVASIHELEVAALRSRARGVVATATTAWKPEKREKAAKKGEALPDGSYPIHDKTDLQKAIQASGRAKDKAKVRRHIIKRARALKATELIPESWK